ncbi:Macrolide export ATP-binding/permease protein MacB [bacterium HR11]|nr:Macrolide export ATP-binding/permease protein MacB [bacterium HR11]
MNWRDALRMAVDRLSAHPLQTALSLLAVAVGILALVGVSAFVEGVARVINSGASLFSPRSVLVHRLSPAKAFNEKYWLEVQRRPYLTLRDAAAIQRHASAVESTGIYLGIQPIPVTVIVSYGTQKTAPMLLRGVDERILELLQLNLAEGRAFTAEEVRAGRRVVLIGQVTKAALFPDTSPLGRTVRLDGIPFQVVGVLGRLPQVLDFNPNQFVFIPYTVYRRYSPRWEEFAAVATLARSERVVWTAIDQITAIMRWRHRLRPDQPDDFEIITQRAYLEFWQNIEAVIRLTSFLISSVALLVGGIGITAVMVVAVTERTREIGLRKALGARPRDIAVQFLLETLSLTLLGGLLGIGLSVGVMLLMRQAGLPVAFTLQPFGTGVVMAVLTGVAAGMYPAVRASRLDPVEALRYE